MFLGPAAENDQMFESLVVEFLRDHSFWRRNFHPEDGQRISAQARNDPFRSDLFHGGLAEDSFGQQLDSIIAQRVTSRSNLPIVESVYNHITQQGSRVNTHG